MISKPERKDVVIVLGALLAAYAVYQNIWIVDARGFFMADDWGKLHAAAFQNWDGLYNFTLLPRQFYLDRPVGMILIKVTYDLFGVNYSAFGIVWLLIHLLNCWLIYQFTKNYLSPVGAFWISILSCAWFSANTALAWTAAVYDVTCATFCLLTLVLHQSTIRRRSFLISVAQIISHLLAIRSKEIAIGLVVPLFLTSLLLEKRSIRDAIKNVAPNILITAIYVVTYLSLRNDVSFNTGDYTYSLHLSPAVIVINIFKYLRMLLFVDRYFSASIAGLNIYFDRWYITFAVMIVLFIALIVMSFRERWNILLFSLSSFLITLGPVLMLKSQFSELYLYTPHFFFAIVCCVGLGTGRRLTTAISALLIAMILLLQTHGSFRTKQTKIHFDRTEICRQQLEIATCLLKGHERNRTVAIAGVEPYFNPFEYGEGYSLQVMLGDPTTKVLIGQSFDDLKMEYCKLPLPRRFIDFTGSSDAGVTAIDITEQAEINCKSD